VVVFVPADYWFEDDKVAAVKADEAKSAAEKPTAQAGQQDSA
jgi:hypothetical protein